MAWSHPPPLTPHDGVAVAQAGNATSVFEGNALLSQPLLTIWSMVCAAVIVLNFTVMVMASLIQLSVVHATGDEGVGDFQAPELLYTLDGRKPDGIILHEEQFLSLWKRNHDTRFRNLMLVFSYGVPLYFISLGLGVLIKFYMSPVRPHPAAVMVKLSGSWLVACEG